MTFRALLVEKGADGTISQTITKLDEAMLPEGDVTVAVSHTTLNYKDGLCLHGLGGLVRTYPHVPGIDFSNDPLLQGRLFSYTDTQISRLGGPNFHEIPINRPVAPFHNNQRDAQHRSTIHKGRAAYEPNSIDGGWPKETPPAARDGGFESYPERIDANKIRQRSE